MEEKLEQLTLLQSLLIGVGFAAFYYFMVYSVTNSDAQIEKMNTEILEVTGKINAVDLMIREKQELEAELLKNAELVKSSSEIMTKDLEKSAALEKLTIKARSYGLSIESIGSFGNWKPLGQFLTAELSVGLRGTFGQAMFFISDLTREDGFFTFNDIKLTPVSKGQGKNAERLNITLKVEIFKHVQVIPSAGEAS